MAFDPYYGSLTDDELLGLAQQAGYFPQPEPEPVVEPEAHPAATPPQVQTPPDYGSLMISGGISERSFSTPKFQEVDATSKGLPGAYQRADATAHNRAVETMQPALDAAKTGREAEVAKANAEVSRVRETGQQALVMQRLQDDFAVEEAKMNAEAQGMANQAKSDYMRALIEFRASKVDPAQMWGNMSGGERFGTLVTAFVHDFLGAKGVNTSAMATFNKAIDRNIDAQLQAIRTKGEVAEGFKSLWWMQRNQSASDAEARARVRGFMLEGTKQAVIAAMAPYEAALASAQGKAAIAKIDEELSKTLIDIYRHADQNAIALRNQALQEWQTKVQAAMQQKAIESQEKIAEGKNKGGGLEPIYDPETGEARWFFQPWIQDTEKAKTRETMEALHSLNSDLTALRDLARNMDSIADPAARTRFADTNHANYDALATRLAHNFAKANGERATDQDVADFKKGMPMKTWLTQANVDQMLAFTQKSLLTPALSKVRSVAFDMPEELKAAYGRTASIPPFQGAIADAANTVKPPVPTSDDILRESALEGVSGPQGKEELEEVSSEVRQAHKKAGKTYPHLFKPKTAAGGIYKTPDIGAGTAPAKEEDVLVPVRRFQQHMVELRRLARKGDKAAFDQLTDLARPYTGGFTIDDPEAAFAALMLSTIEEE